MSLIFLLRTIFAGDCAAILRRDIKKYGEETFKKFTTFYAPIAYYGISSPLELNLPLFMYLTINQRAEYQNGKYDIIPSEVAKNNIHNDFEVGCPMYTKGMNETCCLHKEPDGYGVTLFYMTRIQSHYDNYKFKIFPKCYNLIKYIPCAICHANLSKMTYIVTHENKSQPPIRSFSLCSSYATKIYYACKNIFYNDQRIIPKGFSLNDFKKIVHSPQKDIPNENCISSDLLVLLQKKTHKT